LRSSNFGRLRLVKTYSGGMQRRLEIAMGLLHSPQVLFLDEPTTGLDPEARVEMWREIERLAADQRMTILLTTHYLEEADRLASMLAIIDRGKVVTRGTPDELKSELHGDAIQVELADPGDWRASAALGRVAGLGEVKLDGRVIRTTALRQVYLRGVRVFLRQPAYLGMTLIQPIIWLLLFGALFKAVTEIPGFHGSSYIDFLTPGVVVMLAVFSAGWIGMGFIDDINTGVMDRMLASPVWRGALNAGTVALVAGRLGLLAALTMVCMVFATRAFAKYQRSL
jgi:hypothetical protein